MLCLYELLLPLLADEESIEVVDDEVYEYNKKLNEVA